MRVERELLWHHKHLVANNLLLSLLFFDKQASKSLYCLNNFFKYRNESLAGRLPGVEWKLHHACLDFCCVMILFIIHHNAQLYKCIYVYLSTHICSPTGVFLYRLNGWETPAHLLDFTVTSRVANITTTCFLHLLLSVREHNPDNSVCFFHVTVA